MTDAMNWDDYNDQFSDSYIGRAQSPKAENIIRQQVHDALKALLELGYLYTSKRIDISEILKLADSTYTSAQLEEEFTRRRWAPYSHNQGFTSSERLVRHHAGQGTDALGTPAKQMRLTFLLPTAKTWCARCNETTLHDSIPHSEYTPGHLSHEYVKEPLGHQTFVLNYQCQQCKCPPVMFMIRRELLKLQLCGRSSPHIPQAPSDIPKALRPIYNDAMAAAACADIPAAFYHWRTLIEHQMKTVLGIPVGQQIEGDELASRYNKAIDAVLAERASLTSCLKICSQHLHARTGTIHDVQSVRQRIEQHFTLARTLKELQ
jgi:hypothetical protein